jgi:Protein of unknown function (DUF1186)/PBS lyase HEAT-like repeat
MTQSYPPPVDRLLTLGEPGFSRDWLQYSTLGLTADHVPDLIRMAGDRVLLWAVEGGDEIWAPIHAWRALGQLRTEDAVEPLLELLDEADEWEDHLEGVRDWVHDDVPEVLARIGTAAIPGLIRFLQSASHGAFARATASHCLQRIAEVVEEARGPCVAAMVRVLENEAESDPELNGMVICRLIDLGAAEAAPAIERAFADERVDESIPGDWEDVQVALGLIPERISPRKRVVVHFSSGEDDDEESDAPPLSPGGWRPPPRRTAQERKTAKAKRKAEKASRRRNRRR